ncbi:MAG: hypothetical protein ACFFB0_01765 [Promethearchaeota archaeon]
MVVEKPKTKKKVLKKKRFISEHKRLVAGGIIVAIAIAGVISGIVLFVEEPKGGICIIGIIGEIGDIDPIIHG